MAIRTIKKKSIENSLNTIQNIYEGNAGFNTNLSQVVDRIGVQQRPIQQGRCYTFDGIDDAIFRNMTGVTIISYSGTAILSIPGTLDRINATAGTVWDIRLSDGTFYKCDEGDGTLAIDSSVNGLDGQLTNIALNTFHTLRTDGEGADWQNQVGSTPNIRFNGTTGTSGINLSNSANAQFIQHQTFTIYGKFVGNGSGILVIGTYNSNIPGHIQVHTDWVSNRVRVYETGAYIFSTPNNSISLNVEIDWAIVRQGTGANQTTFYINGVSQGTFTWANTTTSNQPVRIGQDNQNISSIAWIGWQRNIGLSTQAIWTSNYTPPSTWSDYETLQNNFTHKWIVYNFQTIYNPFNLVITTSTDTHSHFVPRNESNVNFDAYGQPLFYKNRVKYNAELRQSNCLTFDGIDDRITLLDSVDYDFGTGNFTIDFWINATTWASSGGTDRGIFDASSGLSNYEIYVNSAGNNVGFSTGTTNSVPTTALPTNTWHHIAFVRTGTTIITYYNFIEVLRVTDASSINANVAPQIGAKDAISFFSGRLANFRITKGTALTIAQLKDYTNLHTNTVFSMPLQEGAGDTVFSRVGGHIGTMNNFNLINAWANKQDVVHNNLFNGYEEYTDGGSGLIRVPLNLIGASLGAVIPGYNSQGVRNSKTWHNDAETLTRQYQAPELLRNDNANTMFTLGVPNNMTWNTGLINSGNFIKTDLNQASQKRKARFRVKKIN